MNTSRSKRNVEPQEAPLATWQDRGCIIDVRPHPYGGLTYTMNFGDGKITTTRPRFSSIDGLRLAVAMAVDAIFNPFRLRCA